MEETLADIVLFGSLRQGELAVGCATRIKRGEAVDYQPLIEELRSDLRRQWGWSRFPLAWCCHPQARTGRCDRGRGDGEGGNSRRSARRRPVVAGWEAGAEPPGRRAGWAPA